MGGLFEKPQGASPEVIPGFEFLPKFLQDISGNVDTSAVGGDPNAGAGKLGGLPGGAKGGVQSGLGIQGPSTGAFLTGLESGFAPSILSSVEGRLRPALERSFTRGTASLREQASRAGLGTSTGTLENIADLRGQLEGGLLQQLAGIEGNLAQRAQRSRTALASQGVGQGINVFGALLPAIGQILQESQFSRTLPLQAAGALSGAAANTPLFQPTFGTSKGESLLSAGGAAAGGAFGGPAGAKAGGQLGSAVGGGGGGGGGK